MKLDFCAVATAIRLSLAVIFAAFLSACASFGSVGPSSSQVRKIGTESYLDKQIALIKLDPTSWQRISNYEQSLSFAQRFGENQTGSFLIGPGDVLDIALWEAPPAVLFGGGSGISGLDAGAQGRNVVQQIVDGTGRISIPFAGQIEANGLTSAEVERIIVARLTGRANNPQASVRLVQNDSHNVTVLGEVAQSRRVPLGPRGQRILDVIASAGGVRVPLHQATIQVSRAGALAAMPLDSIIADPSQNIHMKSEDIVTVQHQPYSFIALGAVARSAEIPFEGRGISLAQALARIGGLRQDQASISGVFIFRLEDPAALSSEMLSTTPAISTGKIPVIYQLDLSDARGFFIAHEFKIRNQDVIYVATARGAALREFIATITNLTFSAIAIRNVVAPEGRNSQ